MTAKDHNKVISILFFVNAGLMVFAGLIVLAIYGIGGVALLSTARDAEAQTVGGIFIVLAIVMGLVMLVFAGFFGYAGLKMRKTEKIGRTLGIIGSILSLTSFPLGTALGVYGLWFFFGQEGKNLYEGGSMMNTSNIPPPPNSWQ